MDRIIIMLLVLIASSCSNIQNSENGEAALSEEDSMDSLSLNGTSSIRVSEYTGLNDGYDFKKENPIDSAHIVCNLAMPFDIYINKSGNAYSIDFLGHKEPVSKFFCKATLEDIDALFIQRDVPIELSRKESEWRTSDGPMSLTFEIYYNGIKKEEKIVFDSRYDVEYSIRFGNLLLRLHNIGEIIYEGCYHTE